MSLDGEPTRPIHEAAATESSPRTLTYADITPTEVTPEVYEQTRNRLNAMGWQIIRTDSMSLRQLAKAGKLLNHAHGSDNDELLDYVPPILEVAIDSREPTFKAVNQPLAAQITQLDQLLHDINHPIWLNEGEELDQEEIVEGVKASLLPGAVVTQLAEAYRVKTRKPLLADVVKTETEDGVLRDENPFAVSCIDSPDGIFRLAMRQESLRSTWLVATLWDSRVKTPPVRTLRALILPTPKK